MPPTSKPPDFSSVTDPTARAMLQQMAAMLDPLERMVAQLQQTLEQQAATNEKLQAENAELRRLLFGRKSERLPPIHKEVQRRRGNKASGDADKRRAEGQKKRKRKRKAKKKLPTEQVVHDVPEEDQVCPHCGGSQYQDLGQGESSDEYEWVPGHFVRRRHVRRKKACRCGQHILTAPGPVRVTEGTQYGPGLHAQVVVAKLCDSLPLYRQAKQMARVGLPINRSTLCDLYHRCGKLLRPLHDRMLEQVKQAAYVNADETPIQVLAPEKTRRAYIWTFTGGELVTYVYSPSRSGQTPKSVLADTRGFLQVDGYSGYNQVCVPDGRTRVGCLAHVRRYFFRALDTAPTEARWFLDRIADLYAIEYEAAERGILGTDKHLALRRLCSAPLMEEIELYLEDEKGQHLPEGPMNAAIKYADNNWESLTHFLQDPRLSLDNNLSERLLRIIALGRKNFLFLGNDDSGEDMAVLQSLVSTCELCGQNPFEYLRDILIRVAEGHPNSRIDDLLPHNWQPPDSS